VVLNVLQNDGAASDQRGRAHFRQRVLGAQAGSLTRSQGQSVEGPTAREAVAFADEIAHSLFTEVARQASVLALDLGAEPLWVGAGLVVEEADDHEAVNHGESLLLRDAGMLGSVMLGLDDGMVRLIVLMVGTRFVGGCDHDEEGHASDDKLERHFRDSLGRKGIITNIIISIYHSFCAMI